MKIQLTEKQLKNVILNETRTEESLNKRGNVLYKAIKSGKFNFPFYDNVYGDSQSNSTREISFKGTMSYTLPDDYTIELIKDEDTFRLGIIKSGYNHIRFYINNNPKFRFTGIMRIHDLDRDDIHEEHFENEPIGNIDLLGERRFKVFERLDKFIQKHYNVSIKKRNNTYDINEERSEESLNKRGKVIYTAIKKGQFKISISDNKTVRGDVARIQIEGMVNYTLPDEYNILLHTVSNPNGGPNVMSIRYMIDDKIKFDFTGNIVITDSTDNIISNMDFNNESSQQVPYLKKKYYQLLRQLSYSSYRKYGVTIQEAVYPSVEINEGSHSTKELSKLIDWAMKKMDCYVTRTTNGMKLCPPEHIKEPCYVAHFSDKAVRPLMAAISKWFGSTKHDVERAYGANRPL